jgi:CubicO group peptidase (beta-lactamase class C family)
LGLLSCFGYAVHAAALPTLGSGGAAGSYTWAGINNTYFWVDPKNGIGVVMMTQVLPFYNATSMDMIRRFEHLIYENLAR